MQRPIGERTKLMNGGTLQADPLPLITREQLRDRTSREEDLSGFCVPADLIAEEIRNSAPRRQNPDRRVAVFRNATVTGELVVQNQHIDKELTFTGCRFFGPVMFKHCTFERAFAMDRCTLRGDIYFGGSIFESVASFRETEFASKRNWSQWPGAGFADVLFKANATFVSASFGYVCFLRTTFQGDAEFARADIAECAYFPDVTFHRDAWFDLATVRRGGKIVFRKSVFEGDASFTGLRAPHGSLFFTGTESMGHVNFTDARIKSLTMEVSQPDSTIKSGTVSKTGTVIGAIISDPPGKPAVFRGTVSFLRARFYYAWLDQTEFKSGADFIDARFDSILSLHGSSFDGPANFEGCRVDWALLLSEGTRFDGKVEMQHDLLATGQPWWRLWRDPRIIMCGPPSAWRQLEKAFESTGNLAGKNECMFMQRRTLDLHYGKKNNSRVWTWFTWAFWGYGVRPLWLFLGWIIPSYFLASVVFALVFHLHGRRTRKALRFRNTLCQGFWLAMRALCSSKPAFLLVPELPRCLRRCGYVYYGVSKALLLLLLSTIAHTNETLYFILGRFFP